MKPDDINEIMKQVLYEFPITEVEFYIPKWVEMLSREHRIKKDLLEQVRSVMNGLEDVRSIVSQEMNTESSYICDMEVEQVEMDSGKVRIQVKYEPSYYYEVLSELTGTEIRGEYELISTVKELASMREELSKPQGRVCECEDERVWRGNAGKRRYKTGRTCHYQAGKQVRRENPFRGTFRSYDPCQY